MPIHDISVPISASLLTWPGEHASVQIEPLARISEGSPANVSRLTLGTHTGTHVDPPLHFIAGGKAVDQLDLTVLIGPALVVDLRHQRIISVVDLEVTVPNGIDRLLFKTDNSCLWAGGAEFISEYVALTAEAARWLVKRKIKLVGTDYLSVQNYSDPHPGVHNILLRAGVIIVEGLNLLDITPGLYQLVCLPLRIAQGDGAPARAVLIS